MFSCMFKKRNEQTKIKRSQVLNCTWTLPTSLGRSQSHSIYFDELESCTSFVFLLCVFFLIYIYIKFIIYKLAYISYTAKKNVELRKFETDKHKLTDGCYMVWRDWAWTGVWDTILENCTKCMLQCGSLGSTCFNLPLTVEGFCCCLTFYEELFVLINTLLLFGGLLKIVFYTASNK